MFTEIRNTKTGKTKIFRTQQYSIGCYIIEDDDPQLQYGLKCSMSSTIGLEEKMQRI